MRDRLGDTLSEVCMDPREGQKVQQRRSENFDIAFLGILSSLGICHFAFGKALGGAFGLELGPNLLNRFPVCPYSS
jgi:hypothetical protein